MENVEIVYGVVAIIVFCVLVITKALVSKYKGEATVQRLQKYKPLAIMAAKWVEKTVPNDYGIMEEDPIYAKGAHKLDQFLIKFIDLVEKTTGNTPSQVLKDEAMKWTIELADRVGK